ncbi:FAD-dependent monooxygenase [Streptomyces sp. XM4011]|uniref:FAD-dependent oxidoreductase n=1 Tax=Streptomyces sp. XM4011 TaxID=2929780 RepID=UPI001FFAE01C|nr:NAD(P)/FAD-dependent oxidoreductase [Streptomyces sp. XM4011]MCK1815695.1 FAD-dependent monooxygenase [Streptomyces sp. XM4011]
MSDERTDCVVVGGGPSGLLLALLLARAGRQVTVVERGDGSGPPPVNISPFLSPPSLLLFAGLGMADELAALGQPVREVVEHTADDRFVLDYATHGGGAPPYALSVPLWSLSRMLREALAREATATVLLSSSVLGLEARPDEVEVELPDRTVTTRFLMCSDGKFSTVRELAGIEADVFTFDRPMVMVLPPRSGGWPERLAIHHTERDALVAAMPVADGILAAQWLADPAEFEAVRAGDVDRLHDRFNDVVPELAGPLAAVKSWDDVLIVQHHVVQPHVWSRGRVALLGDTAHGVHSLGGQGLNMGIQDAVVLAGLLAEAGPDAGTEPLLAYEKLRRPFVEEFQRYQMSLPQLTSTAGPGDGRPIYAAVAEIMASGQPGLSPGYRGRRGTSG